MQMLNDETTMERALREEGAVLAFLEAYKNGKVLNATEKEVEDYLQRAFDELKRIRKVINSPVAIEEQIKSSQKGFSKSFNYPNRLLTAYIPVAALDEKKKAS